MALHRFWRLCHHRTRHLGIPGLQTTSNLSQVVQTQRHHLILPHIYLDRRIRICYRLTLLFRQILMSSLPERYLLRPPDEISLPQRSTANRISGIERFRTFLEHFSPFLERFPTFSVRFRPFLAHLPYKIYPL